ncbi:MAG: sugar-binding transcriptional regulator [Alphaproteobacteria bacterium]|nr:sugar-binding transcriptional regulator [Alphaproteobacteria bacterium]
MRPVRSEDEGNESSDAATQLAARICWHYFKEAQTQEAIAQRLGLTRKRVNQILNDARASGFVQVTINSPISACIGMESRLMEAYGLRRAIVVPSPDPGTDVRTVVGAAAGQYVSDTLAAGASIGIAWGGTINAAAQNIRHRQRQGNSVVLLCGGLSKSTRINPYDNAAMFARALDATCFYVTAPMFADTSGLRDALLKSAPIRGVFEMAQHVDMALLSAVDLSQSSKALEYEVISREDWRSLRDAGAVGDICGHYLDAEGRAVVHPLAGRAINPKLGDLRKIPELVLAAGGVQKVPIIRGALRAGLSHVLITDEAAASGLLAKAGRASS